MVSSAGVDGSMMAGRCSSGGVPALITDASGDAPVECKMIGMMLLAVVPVNRDKSSVRLADVSAIRVNGFTLIEHPLSSMASDSGHQRGEHLDLFGRPTIPRTAG